MVGGYKPRAQSATQLVDRVDGRSSADGLRVEGARPGTRNKTTKFQLAADVRIAGGAVVAAPRPGAFALGDITDRSRSIDRATCSGVVRGFKRQQSDQCPQAHLGNGPQWTYGSTKPNPKARPGMSPVPSDLTEHVLARDSASSGLSMLWAGRSDSHRAILATRLWPALSRPTHGWESVFKDCHEPARSIGSLPTNAVFISGGYHFFTLRYRWSQNALMLSTPMCMLQQRQVGRLLYHPTLTTFLPTPTTHSFRFSYHPPPRSTLSRKSCNPPPTP